MAIYDEWFHPDLAQSVDANRGVNVRMYDPEAKVWKMMWIATGARVVQDRRDPIAVRPDSVRAFSTSR
ncbi:MAG: hypothetical protein WD002_12540 [Pseudomonadales bacterium]